MEFNSKYSTILKSGRIASDQEIESEPMIYGGSIEFCRKNSGGLTNGILDAIETEVNNLMQDQAYKGYHPVIDTKSVMLMPGWYPCIPGWHCDGVIRKTKNSQPDLSTLNEDIWHFTSVISSRRDMESTEIIDCNAYIDVDENHVWQSVDNYLRKNKPPVYKTESGEIIQFSRSTLHNCPPVTVRGWRYFFRLSFYHMPVMNKIRKQVQIYTDINKGW